LGCSPAAQANRIFKFVQFCQFSQLNFVNLAQELFSQNPLTTPTPYDIIRVQKRKELITMIIEPTIGELVFYAVIAGIGLVALIIAHLPWNDKYDPKGDDPYRYCPKEEDEW
jgi:hypothetical protein